ncbi:3-isopropylmalate dehydrogenase [Striga asiatica]|uniref:3-isopropylmalate dehydrogenase n=1 Tax=Striga asiatica TaxID=4170 RepID=A0A5A7Q4W9_STRAF|nr:3-isopropylmalate dehydrogenase [Striga asiatica]
MVRSNPTIKSHHITSHLPGPDTCHHYRALLLLVYRAHIVERLARLLISLLQHRGHRLCRRHFLLLHHHYHRRPVLVHRHPPPPVRGSTAMLSLLLLLIPGRRLWGQLLLYGAQYSSAATGAPAKN